MKVSVLTIIIAGVLSLTTGCRRDFFEQARYSTFSSGDLFTNQAEARSLPLGTIARGHLQEDREYYTGLRGTNLLAVFPVKITREVLERGRARYDIYCSVCHGRTGEGNGMIIQRGFPAPPSFRTVRLRQAPVGHFYDVITQGYGVMYSYAARVEPDDRWAIAAYIRALQLSHNGRLEDVPPSERALLAERKP